MLLPRILLFLSCLATPMVLAQDYHSLFMAVQGDRAKSVRMAVQKGSDVNDTSEGPNLLVFAVALERLNALEALLDLGADYTFKTDAGYNLFDAAAEEGLHRVLNFLANYKDASGNFVIREALLKEPPHPEDGLYPIHRACQGGSGQHAKAVTEFIDMGVPWDLKTADGRTCMDLTTHQIIKYVLKHAEAEAKGEVLEDKGEEL
jgi:hypothetical protein